MARRKKITKKKLKEPDEFIGLTEKAYRFFVQYHKPMVTGGIILLVVVLVIILYQKWEKRKEIDAEQRFAAAVQLYQGTISQNREGSPSEYKGVSEKLDEVIAKFPRTTAGKLSLLYKGNLHLQMGEFGEAIKEYQNFLQKAGKVKLYHLLAAGGMGYAYEEMKDYEKALQAYQMILKMGESFETPNAYLNMGRCYEKLGKKKEALENYRAFIKISEKSPVANAVLRKISFLEK